MGGGVVGGGVVGGGVVGGGVVGGGWVERDVGGGLGDGEPDDGGGLGCGCGDPGERRLRRRPDRDGVGSTPTGVGPSNPGSGPSADWCERVFLASVGSDGRGRAQPVLGCAGVCAPDAATTTGDRARERRGDEMEQHRARGR